MMQDSRYELINQSIDLLQIKKASETILILLQTIFYEVIVYFSGYIKP